MSADTPPTSLRKLKMSWQKGLFRQVMRAVRSLPGERRQQARLTCRSEFLAPAKLGREEAERKARQSIEYVEMLTPARRKGRAGRYVVRDGELAREDEKARAVRGALLRTETGITSEHLERHHKLLRRQHFMDRN